MVEEVKRYGSDGVIPSGLPGGFFVYEAEGEEKILFADQNVIELYGCKTFDEFFEYVGGSFQGMVHPEDLHKIENQIQAQTVFGEKRHDYVRYRIITKKGEIRFIEDFGHLLHYDEKNSFFYVFIVDVDQNEFMNKNRNSLAEAEILSANRETDELTGLFNMPFFYHKVQMMLMTPESRRRQISFIHFDVPNFKLYNERHGFTLGDELLCDVAKVLRETFVGATIARFSDDHFFVCADGDKQTIEEKVDQVYKALLRSNDVNKRVRIKAGIFYLDDRRSEIGLACDHARLACTSIKGRHDVNFCVYDDMLRERLRKQQYVVDHVDEAIEMGYIKVFYQPVIRVKSGEICGYEALVRWIDPKMGMLSPGDFIETLEQSHLVYLVDRYVVRKVCEDIKTLTEKGEPVVPVSINISRMDFDVCDIFGYIEKTREGFDVPRTLLDLEITESALNDNEGVIKSECEKMSELGYHIWLDDFGSGYSSLNTITEYNFDVLKLDLVFLRCFDRNPKTAMLMQYIIEGSKAMGLAPLCEGVESENHYEFLKKTGCERAQGYYFGKPMPLEESRAFTRGKGMQWEKT
ncbi:MAG: GGDEF and EAL domain-containing protein [Lachnospiraceae bacterium]|nr:GGDEF and EAL domain-containing protein [Lachnospiraceae bacterium]